MKINDLANKRVKLSAATITVKDDANKTRGMVRNIRQFSKATNGDRSKWFKALKTSGIWDAATTLAKLLDRIYIDGNNLILLRDMRYEEHYKRFGYGLDADDKHYNLLQQVYSRATENNITVISCFII